MSLEHDSSEFLFHVQCESCGSSDANGVYDDGHQYCFACESYVHGEGDNPQKERKKMSKDMIRFSDIDIRRIAPRGLSEETCKKWGYGIAQYGRSKVHVANYRDSSGQIVAQKTRNSKKDFAVLGDLKEALPLYGMWLWRESGKRVVITEGEIDALSVSQVQGNKWPVVSVPTGAKGAKKAVAKAIEWLEQFEEVIFMFDNDAPGREATSECVAILSPGKAKVAAAFPDDIKDANDALVQGNSDAIMQAIWNAKEYRPDGIISLSDLREDILKPIKYGLPWWTSTLTDLTYGRRWGEVYALAAGTGIGKTDMLTQQIQYDITELDQPVAVFMLEQMPTETGKRICGKFAGKRFHVPDGTWSPEELLETLDKVEASGKLYLYDHFGCTDWDVIESRIRYLVHSQGVRIFYIDHLTALATGSHIDDERKELERIMALIGGIVKELNIIIHLVSHLATPEGKPHEEGGRVMIRHFKGSRAIGYWCHFMFGMERNQQADDEEERQTTTFRVLKDRYTGQSTGQCVYFGYDQATGLLHETDPAFLKDNDAPPPGGDDDCPF